MKYDPQQLDQMLELNKKQADFYDGKSKSGLTRIWSNIRGQLSKYRDNVGIKDDIYELHRIWLDDLSREKVLDLGCGRGNYLMLEIAGQCASYVAIDISEEAIAEVKNKLNRDDLPKARAEVIDFLSPAFTEKFDVIYAYGVLHHFRHFDVLLNKLASHLNDGGIVISHDPMNTAPLVKLFRALYRPFQADREWEWPFTVKSLKSIQGQFEVERVQGVLGHSKWPFFWFLLFRGFGERRGKKAHQRDMQEARAIDAPLYRCLQVSLLLRKRR